MDVRIYGQSAMSYFRRGGEEGVSRPLIDDELSVHAELKY